MEDRREKRDEQIESRSAERFAVRADVEFVVGGVHYVATAENLSVQGAFVATEMGVFERMPVDVSLFLEPTAEPLKLVGKVVRLARRRDERPGFAIAFDAISDATRKRIVAALGSD